MGRYGFHVSIAGGIPLAVARAEELGCTTMQVFSHSPRSWRLTDISSADAEAFKAARSKSNITPLFVHTSYLINLASASDALYEKSIDALRTEMLRADVLGAEYVVTHLGSASGSLPKDAMSRVAAGIGRTLRGLKVGSRLLLENTAGESGDVGSRFEDIAWIMENSGIKDLGVAFDTCHGFGAGYDLKHKKGLDEAIEAMDASFGLENVRLIHLNDSKYPLGSHKDRHEHIGKGMLGRAAFRMILNHPRLRDLPFVMETPKTGPDDDARNMSVVKTLIKSA